MHVMQAAIMSTVTMINEPGEHMWQDGKPCYTACPTLSAPSIPNNRPYEVCGEVT